MGAPSLLLALLSPHIGAYSPAFEVTSADSMTMVTRDWLPQRQCMSGSTNGGKSGRGLWIDMAQNEVESAQLVVYVPAFMPAAVVGGVSVRLMSPALTSETGDSIPAEDVTVDVLGFVKGGPCPFDAEDASCPADKPLRCRLGDAANMTTRCVGRGAESVQCVGCSSSESMINFRAQYHYNDSKAWYPWALLDHVRTFDVRRGTAQPVLVTVRTRTGTRPGLFSATLGVFSATHGHSSTSLTVRVHDVTLPQATESLSLWCAQDTESQLAFGHTVSRSPSAAVNLSAFAELLSNHRLPAATCIYEGVWAAYLNRTQPAGQQPLPLPAAEAVKGLWARGQRMLVIATFKKCHAALNASGCSWQERMSQMMAAATFLQQAGWPQECMYVYMLDEAHAHAALRTISQRVKKLLPKAQTVVTGDNAFPFDLQNRCTGPDLPSQRCMSTADLESGGLLEFIDWFIPRTSTYANQTASHLAAIRVKGKKIGWYTSGIPGGDNALQIGYLEYSAIRPRLLLGTAAWKANAEAYLYYSLAGWMPYAQGVLWNPDAVTESMEISYSRFNNATCEHNLSRVQLLYLPWKGILLCLELNMTACHCCSDDGQAQLVVPGAQNSRYGGFLSTLHLEGIRDGIEDLELYRLLNRTVAEARVAGVDATSEAQALEIPDALLSGMSQSLDPLVRTFSE